MENLPHLPSANIGIFLAKYNSGIGNDLGKFIQGIRDL